MRYGRSWSGEGKVLACCLAVNQTSGGRTKGRCSYLYGAATAVGMIRGGGGEPQKLRCLVGAGACGTTKSEKATYHVHVPLLSEDLDLLLGQSSETEHADLTGDVFPVARCALCLEALPQTLAHLRDTTAYRAQVLLPLSEELGVIENAASDARPIRRRVRNFRALQDG